MPDAPKLFKVTIDNITIEVEPGTTILNAARQIGGDVTPPAMCYYSKLQGSGGKCRTCLVEVAAGSTADPRPMPKLVASCRTYHRIGREELSLREHMSLVLRRLQGQRFLEFHQLFDPSRGGAVVVVTFIALLELAREGLIELTQAEAFAPIYVRLAYQPV